MFRSASAAGSESGDELAKNRTAFTSSLDKHAECGVRTTSVSISQPISVFRWPSTHSPNSELTVLSAARQYPAIKNGPLPADAAGSNSFSTLLLLFLIAGVPLWISCNVGGGTKTAIFFGLFTSIPVFAGFWIVASAMSSRKNHKARYPGRSIEHYLTFKKRSDQLKYHGRSKIPMEKFHEMYFEGDVDFKGDCLEAMEYRHDWASFRFTLSLCKYFLFGMLPEILLHSRSQDEEVRHHYKRGDDFYGWFLGPRMIYTSGIISDIHSEESLEQLQDNKMAIVCEKIGLKGGETLLDIGSGWGTLARFASVNFGAHVDGITLGHNQTAWGNRALRDAGIPEKQSKILCMDYHEIPVPEVGYKKVTCLEMAEHVRVGKFQSFLERVYDMTDDDGVFFLQIAGLRKPWQYEDLIWGLFMNKYVLPGAVASAPLGFFVDKLEASGWEIKGIDTVGVHYSATLWRWYKNWMANRDEVEAKYGKRWFRIWEYFLAYSTIIFRQGSATCYQIVLVKNLNSTHRVEGIETQHGLSGALAASEVDLQTWAKRNAGLFLTSSTT
ncbi:hypothetical protein PG999_006965 [Apiospora kogelbergensis]|uniref:sphingolipid C(9)-methyltransferase n=1 Tax=Apiospora kogelbergensis TaxID=1337665 RepID=A0AAW0QWY5_9PEZI